MAISSEFQVFISHDTRDQVLATRLFNILNRCGAYPYIYELFPQYRQDIHLRIQEVLGKCKLFICLLTYNGIQSQWVHQELGAAYALERIIIPCVEFGVNYIGFVQLRQRIDYYPMNFDNFAYQLIYAIRQELLGHDEIFPFTLTCPNGHRESAYPLPTTDYINDTIEKHMILAYTCERCGTQFGVSPWTLEEIRG